MAMCSNEVVKARLVRDGYILAATPNSIKLYDVRKPSIILKDHAFEQIMSESEDNELNDFDIKMISQNEVRIASCFDSGEIYLQTFNLDLL